MKEEDAKCGAVVRLNSGGPKMTIDCVWSYGSITCAWFSKDGSLIKEKFNPSQLTLVKKAK